MFFDQRRWTWVVIQVAVVGAVGVSPGLEVNGSAYAFTVNTSHYLQVLLKMSLCLLLIKVRVTTSTFSRACTYADRHNTTTDPHAHVRARTQTRINTLKSQPAAAPAEKDWTDVEEFKIQKGTGTPPPSIQTHTHVYPVPHLAVTPLTHAPTQPVSYENLQLKGSSLLSVFRVWTVSCLRLSAYTQKTHTCVHALWLASPSRLALL